MCSVTLKYCYKQPSTLDFSVVHWHYGENGDECFSHSNLMAWNLVKFIPYFWQLLCRLLKIIFLYIHNHVLYEERRYPSI